MNPKNLSLRDAIALAYVQALVGRDSWDGNLRTSAKEMWKFADIALEERENVYKKKED